MVIEHNVTETWEQHLGSHVSKAFSHRHSYETILIILHKMQVFCVFLALSLSL